jgi:hypothetical protein
MNPWRALFIFSLFVLLVMFFSVSALAQYGASLQGTVTDESGAVISGARVVATDQATGVSRSTTSGDSGFYRVPGLAPGNYNVDVDAPGFRKQTFQAIDVAAERIKGLDVTLKPEKSQETVSVIGDVDHLQTETANVDTTITSQQVIDLPEFGRDPYELLRITPGVFADGSRQGNGNSLAIPQQVGPGGSNSQIFQTENQVQAVANGQRVSANDFTLDGVSVNSLEWGGAAVVTPNPESVQEISVSSASYSAQDGRNSGAQVKVISKSGANNFHGGAYIQFNDKGLNAFNKYYGPTNVPLSTLTCEPGTPSQFTIVASHCPDRVDQKYRDFAGSIGGPIFKNNLFFFFSYEGVRLNNTVPLRSQTLETPEFEQYVIAQNPGSLAAAIFSTPGIKPRISTIDSEDDCCSLIPGYGLGRWYPAGSPATGGGPDGIPDWGVFDLTIPNSSSGNQYNGRVDYTHGKDQFFASTYIVRLNNFNGGQRPIDDLSLLPHNYAATLGWTRSLSSTMLNELRVNFTRYDYDQTQPTGSTNFGIPQIRLFDFDIGGFGTNDSFLGIEQAGTTPGKLAQNTFALAETLSWVHGRHAWKFGFQGSRMQDNDDEPGAERPQYQFRGLLNFANDACCFYEQVEVNPAANPPGQPVNGQRYYHSNDYAAFAQDDWKVRPDLTLNLGLRWEYFSPLTEAHDTISNYIYGSDSYINGSVCGPVSPLTACSGGGQLYQPDHRGFGPRFGFAWSPSRYNSRLVFRGGFGIAFNRNADVIFSNVRQDTPFSALATSCCYFDPGPIVGAPPGSNILYELGSNKLATSYAPNPAYSNGVAADGALCASAGCASIEPVSLFGALPKEPNPYVYIFSYEAQLEPVRDLVIKLGYQGSRSRKLVRTIDLNRLIPGDTFDGTKDEVQNDGSNRMPCGPTNPTCPAVRLTGNPRFSNLYFPLPDVNASFDAGVFSVNRRFKRGLQFGANYTYSHAIDTASYEVGYQQTDPSDQEINRGSSDFDVRNNFVGYAIWELPFFRSRHDFVGTALGGWMISGILSKHSGFPYSALIGSCDTNNDRNGDGYCPDLPFEYTGGVIAKPSKQDWINGVFPNPSASFPGASVIPPPTGTLGPGCRCRNIFAGPGYTSADMAFSKDFMLPHAAFLGDGSKLGIRADFFNMFNILNLTPLIPATAQTDIVNSGQFGHTSDGLAGRVIQFQARLSF